MAPPSLLPEKTNLITYITYEKKIVAVGRTRTYDLKFMRLASYQLLHPAILGNLTAFITLQGITTIALMDMPHLRST